MRSASGALLLISLVTSAGVEAAPPDRNALARRTKDEFTHAWNGYEKYAKGFAVHTMGSA